MSTFEARKRGAPMSTFEARKRGAPMSTFKVERKTLSDDSYVYDITGLHFRFAAASRQEAHTLAVALNGTVSVEAAADIGAGLLDGEVLT